MTKKKTTDVTTLPDYGADAGDGFNEQDQNFIVVPMIYLLQKNSDPVDEIPGAKPGIRVSWYSASGRLSVPR